MSAKVDSMTDPMTDSPEREAVDTTPRRGHAPAGPAGPRRDRRWTRVLPWLLTVLALAAAVYSTMQWRSLAAQQDKVDSARAAAIGFIDDLTNWDASDGLDDEIDVLREQGTGPFLDEIDVVFGGDDLTGQLEAEGITASGELQEAFVQDVEDEQAEVFTVVSVTYSSPEGPDSPAPVTFPAELELERDDDGEWLIRRVTVPNSEQIGQLMTPSTGS